VLRLRFHSRIQHVVTDETPPLGQGAAYLSKAAHAAPVPQAVAPRRRMRAAGRRDVVLPIIMTAFVLLTAAVYQSPLRDAVTRGDVAGARLEFTPMFIALAPFCALLDMQAILAVPQHIAILATALLAYFSWRILQAMRRRRIPIWYRELGGFLLLLLSLVALIVLNVLVPRPMARLALADPDLVAVDVHAHTASSNDARQDWTYKRVRQWHAKTGFHVAYITDHKRFGGAIDGEATNGTLAGDSVVLITGLELRSGGQHVNVLSMTAAESIYIVHGDHLMRGIRLADGRTPIIVQTIPFKMPMFAGSGQDSLPRTNALELNDGAPKGLTMALTRHAELIRLADSLNVALVAGSDNHGWGNTASGWTLVRVSGWRALTPRALAVRIEETLLTGRAGSQVLERRTPTPTSAASVSFTVPAMLVTVARGLSLPERISWVVWCWVPLLARFALVRRNTINTNA
jgi:hypothetical protein